MHRDLRLLIVSAVLPFPRRTGQQQRVFYKLKALREFFHLTFLTAAHPKQVAEVREELQTLCDEAIVLPSQYQRSIWTRALFRLGGAFYTGRTGLKFSNYVLGQVEFSPSRLELALASSSYDGALFEYWHAHNSVPTLQAKGILCVLDMHDILWQSYDQQLSRRMLPVRWKKWAAEQYRRAEEQAWQQFDALIAINKEEARYVRTIVGEQKPIFYAPMGVDLSAWPYSWQPAHPPRLAYYGGLGSPHNQQAALRCYKQIMPHIWQKCPEAELWLVGSDPPASLLRLPQEDRRVVVTGYVERVQDVLRTMTTVLCPWSGTYGFRSRLIEVMALGVPVVASPEAVYGMDMQAGQGLFLEESDEGMAQACLRLLEHADLAHEQSARARQHVEQNFGYEATYGRLAHDLRALVLARRAAK